MIPKGYYLKARVSQDSEISRCPPHVREVWDWLLMNAAHQDTKICLRGQVLCDYKRIQEDLAWFVGWRKVTYSHTQIGQAMRTIRNASMITTMKTTRKTIVTITNYLRYQDPKNYTNTTQNTPTNTRKNTSSDATLWNKKEELINNNIATVEKMIEMWESYLGMKLTARPSQQKAARAIISRVGEEKALGAAKSAIACQSAQYAPHIANIVQLDKKLDSLIIYNRKQGKDLLGSLIISGLDKPPKKNILSDEDRTKASQKLADIKQQFLNDKARKQ